MSTADIITLQMVHSPQTHHILGAKELSWMKPSGILVNTSRGGLIDTKALVQTLKDRKIRVRASCTARLTLPARRHRCIRGRTIRSQEPVRGFDQRHVGLVLGEENAWTHLAFQIDTPYGLLRRRNYRDVVRGDGRQRVELAGRWGLSRPSCGQGTHRRYIMALHQPLTGCLGLIGSRLQYPRCAAALDMG